MSKKRGPKQDRERALLAFILRSFADLRFEKIGWLLHVTRQRAHQLWIKGKPIYGLLTSKARLEWIERGLALKEADTPIILEHSGRENTGPYRRQMEWDPDRIGKPTRGGR